MFNGYHIMKKLLFSLCILPAAVSAVETGESCSKITDKEQRLACYDSSFLVSQKEEPKDEKKTEWTYSQDKDEMRDQIGYKAINISKNTVHFSFPYGESNLAIVLRKDPKFGNDIMFSVFSGQFNTCFNGCKIMVKFDNNKIESYAMVGTDNGSNDTLFIDGKRNMQRFMDKLRKSKKMIVETSFFNHGKEQFTFDISSLEWKHF